MPLWKYRLDPDTANSPTAPVGNGSCCCNFKDLWIVGLPPSGTLIQLPPQSLKDVPFTLLFIESELSKAPPDGQALRRISHSTFSLNITPEVPAPSFQLILLPYAVVKKSSF